MISNLHKIALAACVKLAESRNPATVRTIAKKIGVSDDHVYYENNYRLAVNFKLPYIGLYRVE